MVKNRHKILVAIIGAGVIASRQSNRCMYALPVTHVAISGRFKTPGGKARLLFWSYGLRHGLGVFRLRGKNYRGKATRINTRSWSIGVYPLLDYVHFTP